MTLDILLIRLSNLRFEEVSKNVLSDYNDGIFYYFVCFILPRISASRSDPG
jgi:hypothetical protein